MTTNRRKTFGAEQKHLGIQTLWLGPQDHITQCSADLRVVGQRADDRRVGELVSLKPTREWARGEVTLSRDGGKQTPKARGLWMLSTDALSSKSIEEHCQVLLKTLRGAKQDLAKLMQDPLARVSVCITFYSGIGHGGFNLAAETVAELAEFCEDLEVHFT